MNDKYYAEVMKTCQNLVDVKAALHKHDKVLDDKIDSYKARLGALDGNCEALKTQNESLQQFVATNTCSKEVTPQNVGELVYPENAISEKLIALQSKISAIEDCMNLVKKAFDKDNIDLTTMLKMIRQLGQKQCKCLQKIRKLMTGAQQQQ